MVGIHKNNLHTTMASLMMRSKTLTLNGRDGYKIQILSLGVLVKYLLDYTAPPDVSPHYFSPTHHTKGV